MKRLLLTSLLCLTPAAASSVQLFPLPYQTVNLGGGYYSLLDQAGLRVFAYSETPLEIAPSLNTPGRVRIDLSHLPPETRKIGPSTYTLTVQNATLTIQSETPLNIAAPLPAKPTPAPEVTLSPELVELIKTTTVTAARAATLEVLRNELPNMQLASTKALTDAATSAENAANKAATAQQTVQSLQGAVVSAAQTAATQAIKAELDKVRTNQAELTRIVTAAAVQAAKQTLEEALAKATASQASTLDQATRVAKTTAADTARTVATEVATDVATRTAQSTAARIATSTATEVAKTTAATTAQTTAAQVARTTATDTATQVARTVTTDTARSVATDVATKVATSTATTTAQTTAAQVAKTTSAEVAKATATDTATQVARTTATETARTTATEVVKAEVARPSSEPAVPPLAREARNAGLTQLPGLPSEITGSINMVDTPESTTISYSLINLGGQSYSLNVDDLSLTQDGIGVRAQLDRRSGNLSPGLLQPGKGEIGRIIVPRVSNAPLTLNWKLRTGSTAYTLNLTHQFQP